MMEANTQNSGFRISYDGAWCSKFWLRIEARGARKFWRFWVLRKPSTINIFMHTFTQNLEYFIYCDTPNFEWCSKFWGLWVLKRSSTINRSMHSFTQNFPICHIYTLVWCSKFWLSIDAHRARKFWGFRHTKKQQLVLYSYNHLITSWEYAIFAH